MLTTRLLPRLPLRTSLSISPSLSHPLARLASTSARDSDRIPTNDASPRPSAPNVSATNAVPVSKMGVESGTVQESVAAGERQRAMQAPNRTGVWSRSQQARERAMTGPRFEQTVMEYQPQPEAAISLIHKQPVRWTDQRVVACDGGGGPLGHPRIFINVDKPQINECTYCGLPFAHNHHRKHLESLASTPYPLERTSDSAVVDEPMMVTDEPFAQR